MKTARTNVGGKGQRSGAWSESKWTNMNKFDLSDTEIDRALQRYQKEIENPRRLAIIVEQPSPEFICPVKRHDIIGMINSIPDEFTAGLQSIIVLKGSRRQAAVSGRGYTYGRYFDKKVFLHPFPKRLMTRYYRKLPAPHIVNDYKRAGATVETDSDGSKIVFTEQAVRDFYLRDVLVHEIGHHVDWANFERKSHKKLEGFAEWFATEYGFRDRRIK